MVLYIKEIAYFGKDFNVTFRCQETMQAAVTGRQSVKKRTFYVLIMRSFKDSAFPLPLTGWLVSSSDFTPLYRISILSASLPSPIGLILCLHTLLSLHQHPVLNAPVLGVSQITSHDLHHQYYRRNRTQLRQHNYITAKTGNNGRNDRSTR